MDNLFEVASRKKYRFSYKGYISTEDLWDLREDELDGIYRALNKQAKTEGEDSLIAENKPDEDLENMIEIVKHVFAVKRAEAEARRMAAENAEKKRRILDIIAQKQDDALRDSSIDDLKKMLDNL